MAVLEWGDPIMGCGYWIPELIQAAGGAPLHCSPPGGATPTITFEALLDSPAPKREGEDDDAEEEKEEEEEEAKRPKWGGAPDVVVFALCGFSVSRSAREISDAWGAERIDELTRACRGNVFVVDGNYLVNRSGPR